MGHGVGRGDLYVARGDKGLCQYESEGLEIGADTGMRPRSSMVEHLIVRYLVVV